MTSKSLPLFQPSLAFPCASSGQAEPPSSAPVPDATSASDLPWAARTITPELSPHVGCAPDPGCPRAAACALWHETKSELPISVNERGLSVSDLGQTGEGMRKKWSVGRPKTLHEIVWWPHLAAPGVGVIRERSPLKMCGTSQVSCHGLGDPVRCRPLLDGPWAGMGIMPCCLSHGPHRGEIP